MKCGADPVGDDDKGDEGKRGGKRTLQFTAGENVCVDGRAHLLVRW